VHQHNVLLRNEEFAHNMTHGRQPLMQQQQVVILSPRMINIKLEQPNRQVTP